MAERPAHSFARLGRELAGQAYQYGQLMRLDKPVGTWLLLWPTLWGWPAPGTVRSQRGGWHRLKPWRCSPCLVSWRSPC